MQNRSWRRHTDNMRGEPLLREARFREVRPNERQFRNECYMFSSEPRLHNAVERCILMIGKGNNVIVLMDLLQACKKADIFRFLEEDRKAKLATRHEQMSQPSRPGMPSQDLMSYWGSHLLHRL